MSLPTAPLAEQLRPKQLQDVVGQDHLLGPGMPIAVAIASGEPHSCIFWGPPGVGKTTIARLMAQGFDAQFVALSAVTGGVKEIREAVQAADNERQVFARRTIVFIDEIHRFNKAQQDALLPHVESGLFTFIGATTENPSFEVNSALLSRSQVYVLKPLDASSLQKIIEIIGVPSINRASIAINSEARDLLVEHADGDGRRLINATSAVLNAAQTQKVAAIDAAFVQRSLGAQLRRFDKGGDQFYDQISALHKSVRGSDPDAALYWFCRMLDGGADPRYLARRILRMATEDIGLADPRALTMALEAMQAYERLGSPEGELMLAQAVVFLSVAPKSNAVYAAFNAAKALVKTDASRAVPLHLRNAPTALMKSLDFGKNYRYAHNEPDAVAAGENYWPDGLPAQSFYQPTPRGLEIKIGERLAEIRAKLSPKAP